LYTLHHGGFYTVPTISLGTPSPFSTTAPTVFFLRRVGGGYIFIHRMLMEHFAAMAPESEKVDNK
jgi:hypothetical protein